VGPQLVVAGDPLRRHATNLAESFKHVAVEHLLSVRSVEAFDETVLHRPARLDEQPLSASRFDEQHGQVLRLRGWRVLPRP